MDGTKHPILNDLHVQNHPDLADTDLQDHPNLDGTNHPNLDDFIAILLCVLGFYGWM